MWQGSVKVWLSWSQQELLPLLSVRVHDQDQIIVQQHWCYQPHRHSLQQDFGALWTREQEAVRAPYRHGHVKSTLITTRICAYKSKCFDFECDSWLVSLGSIVGMDSPDGQIDLRTDCKPIESFSKERNNDGSIYWPELMKLNLYVFVKSITSSTYLYWTRSINMSISVFLPF